MTQVCPVLENLIEECQILSEKSSLPSQPDIEYWENFIIKVMKNYISKEMI